MSTTLKIIPALILFVYIAQVTPIANADSDPVTITITPARVEKPNQDIPGAVNTVGQDLIQSATEQLGLDESLKQIPGLFFLNRYNFAQDLRASIRGFGARSSFGIRGIKIIVDGIPETLPDGQGSVDGVDIGSARQISVIRGPVSALYGNASGGAILIETERSTGLPFAEFKLIAGEYDYQKPQVKLGGTAGNLDYLLNVSDTSIEGYRDHSDFDNTQLSGRFDYSLEDDAALVTTIHHTDQPVAKDPGGITLEEAEEDPKQARDRNLQFDAGEVLEQTRIGLSYKRRVDEQSDLQARIYYTTRDFQNRLPFQGSGAVDLERAFSGGGLTSIHSGEFVGQPTRWLLGFDYDVQDDDRQRYDNLDGELGPQTLDQNEKVTAFGLFMQNETRITDAAELTVGLRFDEIEFDVSDRFISDGDDSGKIILDQISPTIGISVNTQADTRYYASISSSFETPTTTEFANPGGGGFNQDLDPQQARNIEVGIKTQGSSYRFEIALFHIDVDDELVPFELAGQPGRTFYENAGSSTRNGIEIAYQRNLTRQIELALAYTWSDFKFDEFVDDNGNDFGGKQIPGIPENLLQVDLSWRNNTGYFVSLKNTYTGTLYADNANKAKVKSSMLSDLRIGYRHFYGRWEIDGFVGVNNLFDDDYFNNIRINAFGNRYYEPAAERNGLFGITMRRNFSR